jgi:hypothetical protein
MFRRPSGIKYVGYLKHPIVFDLLATSRQQFNTLGRAYLLESFPYDDHESYSELCRKFPELRHIEELKKSQCKITDLRNALVKRIEHDLVNYEEDLATEDATTRQKKNRNFVKMSNLFIGMIHRVNNRFANVILKRVLWILFLNNDETLKCMICATQFHVEETWRFSMCPAVLPYERKHVETISASEPNIPIPPVPANQWEKHQQEFANVQRVVEYVRNACVEISG